MDSMIWMMFGVQGVLMLICIALALYSVYLMRTVRALSAQVRALDVRVLTRDELRRTLVWYMFINPVVLRDDDHRVANRINRLLGADQTEDMLDIVSPPVPDAAKGPLFKPAEAGDQAPRDAPASGAVEFCEYDLEAVT